MSEMSGADHTGEDGRELAKRRSGADEVLLIWRRGSDRVELALVDTETGAEVRLDIEPSDAIDAFHHPYAYLAWRAGPNHATGAPAFV
jgi:hypothetical protein